MLGFSLEEGMAQWGSLLTGLWSEQIAEIHLDRGRCLLYLLHLPFLLFLLHFFHCTYQATGVEKEGLKNQREGEKKILMFVFG